MNKSYKGEEIASDVNVTTVTNKLEKLSLEEKQRAKEEENKKLIESV